MLQHQPRSSFWFWKSVLLQKHTQWLFSQRLQYNGRSWSEHLNTMPILSVIFTFPHFLNTRNTQMFLASVRKIKNIFFFLMPWYSSFKRQIDLITCQRNLNLRERYKKEKHTSKYVCQGTSLAFSKLYVVISFCKGKIYLGAHITYPPDCNLIGCLRVHSVKIFFFEICICLNHYNLDFGIVFFLNFIIKPTIKFKTKAESLS